MRVSYSKKNKIKKISVNTSEISSPTQLSQRLQWEVRGGRNILQVKQYFSFTTCWLMRISLVRGGGRYVEDPEVSKNKDAQRGLCLNKILNPRI